MHIPVAEVARFLGATGPELHSDVIASGVSCDSRDIAPGALFVAMKAERDGHEFAKVAVDNGAGAVLVSRLIDDLSVVQILVDDTAMALTQLGRWARSRVSSQVGSRVIGITGSVGKTSTKDFIAAGLRARFSTGASEKSLNNDQGVPVTLLNAPDDVEALVLEMGMRGFGEIARLAELVRPHIGVVTTVGEAHSERVGGIEGVAQAKSELVRALQQGDFAILNADDHRILAMSALTQATSFSFGLASDADMRITEHRVNSEGLSSFSYESQWGGGSCSLSVPGQHMVSNAASALLVCALCNVNLDDAAIAIGRSAMSPMRMAMHNLPNGVLIDDSYNASPTSVIAALRTLASLEADHRVAVLGVMAEIDQPETRHLDVAKEAERLGIELVAYNTPLYGVSSLATYEAVAEFLGHQKVRTAMLVKGSRVAGLDAVARLLVG